MTFNLQQSLGYKVQCIFLCNWNQFILLLIGIIAKQRRNQAIAGIQKVMGKVSPDAQGSAVYALRELGRVYLDDAVVRSAHGKAAADGEPQA